MISIYYFRTKSCGSRPHCRNCLCTCCRDIITPICACMHTHLRTRTHTHTHTHTANVRCYFVGDEPLGDPNITKVLPWDEEMTMLAWEFSEMVELHRRRYMLKNDALEIFLISGKTLLLSFQTTKVSAVTVAIHSLFS